MNQQIRGRDLIADCERLMRRIEARAREEAVWCALFLVLGGVQSWAPAAFAGVAVAVWETVELVRLGDIYGRTRDALEFLQARELAQRVEAARIFLRGARVSR